MLYGVLARPSSILPVFEEKMPVVPWLITQAGEGCYPTAAVQGLI